MNYNAGGTFTTVVMQSRFEHGNGVEEFVFKGDAEHLRLAGYHINSLALAGQ